MDEKKLLLEIREELRPMVKEEITEGFRNHLGTCPYGRKVDFIQWFCIVSVAILGLVFGYMALK